MAYSEWNMIIHTRHIHISIFIFSCEIRICFSTCTIFTVFLPLWYVFIICTFLPLCPVGWRGIVVTVRVGGQVGVQAGARPSGCQGIVSLLRKWAHFPKVSSPMDQPIRSLVILLSTLTSVASDLFNYALRLDNELSARPPRGRHGLWTGLKTQMGCLQIVWCNQ